MKFSDELTEKLLVTANKIATQKHMCAIKKCIYSFDTSYYHRFLLYIDYPMQYVLQKGNGISLGKLPGMQWLSMFTDWFNAANYATLNFFTVAAVVLIGLELGKLNKMQGFMPGIIALCSFVSCLPVLQKLQTRVQLFRQQI